MIVTLNPVHITIRITMLWYPLWSSILWCAIFYGNKYFIFSNWYLGI